MGHRRFEDKNEDEKEGLVQTRLTVAALFLYFHAAKTVRFAPNANSGIFIAKL